MSNSHQYDPDAVLRQAVALHKAGSLVAAAALYRQLLEQFPANAQLHKMLGTAELQLGHTEEALAELGRAIEIDPNFTAAYVNRGNLLCMQPRFDEALADLAKAVTLDPGNAAAHANHGNVLRELKRHGEAFAAYDRAIALKPDFAEAYANKSLAKLQAGEFAEGWKLFEWRWKCMFAGGDFKRFANSTGDFSANLWTGGTSPEGKRLLVFSEQGFGDNVHFCRYVPMLAGLGADVVFETPKTLLPLMATLKGAFTLAETGTADGFDLYCSVMSLPLVFGTTLETIPAETPYLFADPVKREEWRTKLGAKNKPRIGLVWSGNPKHASDHYRRIPLERLAPLLQMPFEFHSLQKVVEPTDVAALSRLPGLHCHQDELHDFADTAALIAEMDLTISVDTSVAHVAGALGAPVWILLAWAAEWRWLLDRTDCPWYPTATLFRQPRLGDWDGAVAAVIERLQTERKF